MATVTHNGKNYSSAAEVMKAVAAKRLSVDQGVQLIEQLAKSAPERGLWCKVSEKGCLSVYGLNTKWPISLYADQWEKLIEFIPEIQQFAEENRDQLASKSKIKGKS